MAAVFQPSMKASIAAARSWTEVKLARRMACRVMIEMNSGAERLGISVPDSATASTRRHSTSTPEPALEPCPGSRAEGSAMR